MTIQDYIKRVQALDGKIHAFLDFDEEWVGGQEYKTNTTNMGLAGKPIAIKDNMVTLERPTTAGSKILEGFVSPYEATVVSRLKQSGAVLFGKTNLDEFAMGSSTENSAFGPTKNPWDLTRVPGGSSGGSAAAVAAGMAWAALGSDTGGSIRQPAGFCGVVGFKPSYGAVSRYGLIAMASSLDQIGPITLTVGDAREIFEVIAGPDGYDATCFGQKTEGRGQKTDRKTGNGKRKAKVGIPKEYLGEGLTKPVREVFDQAVDKLAQIADVVSVTLPHSSYAVASYYLIMPVEVASNLARFDVVRYGKGREQFGDEVKRRIILGTFASSAGYADRFYLKGQQARLLIKQDFDRAYQRVDYILSPVSPTVAFKIGEKTEDPLAMYFSDIYTIPANLAGLPAISLPAGLAKREIGNGKEEIGKEKRDKKEERSGKELPVGVQLIGPQRSDWQLLDFAENYEKILNFKATPFGGQASPSF